MQIVTTVGLHALIFLLVLTSPSTARACGCLSPPAPGPADTTFAVNQQSEQIIFEVEPGFVTAHVLIRYEGEPSQFAWIVPVPSVPELSLSESLLFALLDEATAPEVNVSSPSLCPGPAFRCLHHTEPYCGPYSSPPGAPASGPGPSTSNGPASYASSGATGGGQQDVDAVDVIERTQVGPFDTIVFDAGDADAAVTWLQSEGFIVNDTMTPFMQPYVDADMLFVAVKLVPEAGVDLIEPLQMRYAADAPMIPLQLTAVAAEPHLTVTTLIIGSGRFRPSGRPLAEIDPFQVTHAGGRVNYPMLLARAIDEAGGDGFIREYVGPPRAHRGAASMCGGLLRPGRMCPDGGGRWLPL